jgi:hypothetical protein
LGYFHPLGLLNNNREGGSSELKVDKEVIGFIVLMLSINDSPCIFHKLNRFCERNFPALILTPISLIAILIKYFAMVELLASDNCEVLLDLDLPLTEDVGFGEMLDQVFNAIESVLGLSDHVASKIPDLIGIFCKVFRQCDFVASRRD